jgi:hypothetical protein
MQSTAANITSSIQDGTVLLSFKFAFLLRSLSVISLDLKTKRSHSISLLEGVATLKMGRLPVNSLNYEFLTDLRQELEKLDEDKDCKAVIITSVTRFGKHSL